MNDRFGKSVQSPNRTKGRTKRSVCACVCARAYVYVCLCMHASVYGHACANMLMYITVEVMRRVKERVFTFFDM